MRLNHIRALEFDRLSGRRNQPCGPRFGDLAVCDLTTPVIQTYVTHLIGDGYAPKSIDHILDVLSAILRSAVKWGHLQANPTRGGEARSFPQLVHLRSGFVDASPAGPR